MHGCFCWVDGRVYVESLCCRHYEPTFMGGGTTTKQSAANDDDSLMCMGKGCDDTTFGGQYLNILNLKKIW